MQWERDKTFFILNFFFSALTGDFWREGAGRLRRQLPNERQTPMTIIIFSRAILTQVFVYRFKKYYPNTSNCNVSVHRQLKGTMRDDSKRRIDTSSFRSRKENTPSKDKKQLKENTYVSFVLIHRIPASMASFYPFLLCDFQKTRSRKRVKLQYKRCTEIRDTLVQYRLQVTISFASKPWFYRTLFNEIINVSDYCQS